MKIPRRDRPIVIHDSDLADRAYLGGLVELGVLEADDIDLLIRHASEIASTVGVGVCEPGRVAAFVGQGRAGAVRDRYATVRILDMFGCRTLTHPPIPRPVVANPANPHVRRRVLTRLEMGLVRLVALYLSDLAVVRVAVLDAGGVSGEYPTLTPDRVEVDSDTTETGPVARLRLPGVGHVRARTVPVPDWAAEHVAYAKHNAEVTGRRQHPISYTGTCPEPDKIQSAALMTIHSVFRWAGLADDPTVEPMSIRNTRGHEVWTRQGLDAAAEVLGTVSGDALRREVGAEPHLPVRAKVHPGR